MPPDARDGAAPTLAAGDVVADSYRVVRLLGRGGMGEVYEVDHLRMNGRFALKVLVGPLDAHGAAVERFRREAEVTSALKHPNIVTVFDFNRLPDGRPFFVMERLDGRELSVMLADERRLPLARVAAIVEQIAQGLAAAHARGVVHRDLKPANVFVVPLVGSSQELVKVLDFGISKVREESSRLTNKEAVLGTPGYMAPEQATGRSGESDARADQFALATIAYELVTGRRAFDGATNVAVLYQIVHEEPRRFAAWGLACPAVEAVLRRALAKGPEARFRSITDFAQAFAAAVREDGETKTVPVTPDERASPGASTLRHEATGTSLGTTPRLAGRAWPTSTADARVRSWRLPVVVTVALAIGATGWWWLGRAAQPVDGRPPAVAVPAPALEPPRAPPAEPKWVVVTLAEVPPRLEVRLDGAVVVPPIRLPADGARHKLTFAAPGRLSHEAWILADRDQTLSLAPMRPLAPRAARPRSAPPPPPPAEPRNEEL